VPISYYSLFVPADQTFMHRIRSIGYPYEISELTDLRSAEAKPSNYRKSDGTIAASAHWLLRSAVIRIREFGSLNVTEAHDVHTNAISFKIVAQQTGDFANRVLSSRSLQTHLFYPGDQSRGFESQKLRGSIDALDFPAGPLQDNKKILALPASDFCIGLEFRFDFGIML